MRTGKSIARRIAIAIALSYVLPPILGIAFLVHVIGLLDGSQVLRLLQGGIVPAYLIGTLLGAVYYIHRLLRPIFELADGRRSLDEVFPRMRGFVWHFWILFLMRHGAGAVIVVFAMSKVGIELSASDIGQMLVLSVPVSVLTGLPAYVYIIDRFADACTRHKLQSPLLRVRTRVFLISVLVPVFLNGIIVIFLRSRVEEISVEVTLTYLVLTLFTIGTAYSLMHSLTRSVAELRKLSRRGKSVSRELRIRTMDEFGVLTGDYQSLLLDLESQKGLLELRNQVLQISRSQDEQEVYQQILTLVSRELDVEEAVFVVVDTKDESCEYLARIEAWPTQAIKVEGELGVAVRGDEARVVFLGSDEASDRVVVVPCHELQEPEHTPVLSIWARLRHGNEADPDTLKLLGQLSEEIASAVRSSRIAAEKTRLERLLVESQRMEVVGHLAAGVAHDFNNILTVVVGATDVLLEEVVEEGDGETGLTSLVRTQADMIKQSSERAVALTQQLLTFSRKKVGTARALNLNAAVTELNDFLHRLFRKSIDLRYDLDDTTGCIEVDPGHIDQVITNLILNAHDASPEGGRIEVRTRQDGNWVVLEIRDHGNGMSKEVLDHIFDPFFTTKSREKGTGLGLATVYGIVESCGGRISVDSEVSVGSVFTLRFPQKDISEVDSILAEEGGGESEIGGPSMPMTAILLAEDDDDVRKMICLVLTRHGYSVIEAVDGNEALRLIVTRDLRIDFLLSDILMPGLTGTEVAAHMSKERPGTKILLMTGYADSEILQSAKRQGLNVMDKPFSPKALIEQIDLLLN